MFIITRPQIKVLSAISSNLAVVWIIASLAATNIFTLILNISSAIISIVLAIKSEELLEEL